MNEELRQQGEEFTQVNSFLQAILASFPAGVVVADRSLHIQVWNHQCEEMWGLRTEEVQGAHFLSLDSGLPVDKVRPALRLCLSGESRFEKLMLDATNRRGKAIRCTITCTPLMNAGEEIRGVMVLIEEQPL